MLRNYIKIAFRNLLKNRTYSLINILGLTVGISCFLVIALYVFDELTYDAFHKNASSVYQLVETRTTAQGKETNVASAGYQVAEQGPVSIPGIKKAVRITGVGRANVSNPENTGKTFNEDLLFANPSFFQVLDFAVQQGDVNTALTAPHSIVMTEGTAVKYFGTTDAMGKTVLLESDTLPYRVTAVLKNLPANSSLSFNLVFSESSIQDERYTRFIANDWSSSDFSTFFLLDRHADATKIAQQLNQLVQPRRPANATYKSSLWLQPLTDIHFHSAGIENGLGGNGNMAYIYIFSVVALFVLVIACINYMNLTTARFANRAKEIAVRKVAGASRKNLVGQFLSEAILMTGVALVLAIILVKIGLPFFNRFAGKQLHLGADSDYRIWAGIAGVLLIAGLLSGAYPAFIQSRLKPLLLLKNKVSLGKGSMSVRQGLVVFQFALSIIMIAATMIVYLQLQFLHTKDMGFNKTRLIVADINSGKVRRAAETIKTEFGKLPAVSYVSVSSRVPGEWKNIPKVKVLQPSATNAEGNNMYFLGIDDQFLSTYEIALVSGTNFTKGAPGDSSAVLINETAAKMLGIKDASEQLIEIPSADFSGSIATLDQPYKVRIKGIVKDFNFRSLREPLAPMIMASARNPIHNIDYFTVRINGSNTSETLAGMEKVIHSIDANHLFEYHFLDKQWELFYQEDQKRQTIFIAVAILTILIACLGLFGLATYAAEQRFKEIGIRKVLGAGVSSIVTMLSKDFLKLVLIASVIALPVAWWAMHNWLTDFAYRITIRWWILAAAGIIAILIALATISFRALKAATVNPVKALRSE